jgi:hypothetical protein
VEFAKTDTDVSIIRSKDFLVAIAGRQDREKTGKQSDRKKQKEGGEEERERDRDLEYPQRLDDANEPAAVLGALHVAHVVLIAFLRRPVLS